MAGLETIKTMSFARIVGRNIATEHFGQKLKVWNSCDRYRENRTTHPKSKKPDSGELSGKSLGREAARDVDGLL